MVGLEHVEPEEEIDVAALHNGERAREVEVSDLQGSAMHAPENLGGPDTLRDPGKAAVYETHDTALFCSVEKVLAMLAVVVAERDRGDGG